MYQLAERKLSDITRMTIYISTKYLYWHACTCELEL